MTTCEEVFDNRPYSNESYLVIPKKIFKIKLYDQYPVIEAFVYQKDNLFGDAMPLNIAGIDIKFRIYNSSNKLISIGSAVLADINNSKIEYKLNRLDIIETGDYYGEFVLTDIDNDKFSLPKPDQRSRIFIKVV